MNNSLYNNLKGVIVTLLEIGKYLLDIDTDKTKEFYSLTDEISCDCQGCRNFKKWSINLHKDLFSFFESLGVNPEKLEEMSICCKNKNGTVFYNGYYNICGKILQGKNEKIRISKNHYKYPDDALVEISESFSVSFFDNDIYLLNEDFPKPVIKMNINADVPWLLDEKCDCV